MTPDAQRIAIAGQCGWKVPNSPEVKELTKNWVTGGSQNHFISPGGVWGGTASLPDYLTDLNAMHEAEKVLLAKDLPKYAEELRRLVWVQIQTTESTPIGLIYEWHSPAAQRAEAFLRTIGKWETSK